MVQQTYQTQDILLTDLRGQTAVQLAASLCCSSVQKLVLDTINEHERRKLSTSSLLLSHNRSSKVVRITDGHCEKGLKVLRNAIRTARSGINGSSDIPLFDEAVFSGIVNQMRRIHLNPEFSIRIFSMAEVVFQETMDVSQRTLESHYAARRSNPSITMDDLNGSTYFNCLAAISFMRAKAKEAKLMQSLMTINESLITSVATPFFNKGLSRDTVVSAGQLGLFRALRRHNVDIGTRLSTTAVPWIKQMILEEFPRQSVVSLPYRLAPKFHRMKSIIAEKPDVTTEELALTLKLSETEVVELRNSDHLTLSLEGLDDHGNYDSFFASNAIAPEDHLANENTTNLIDQILSNLDDMSKEIIKTTMGFESNFSSLKSICDNYGITMSTLQSRRRRALEEMRDSLDGLELDDLMKVG